MNRRHFKQAVVGALESDEKNHAVFILDLDRFMAVNDTLGHPVGDELLCKVSDRLRSATGAHGLLARLGGDEFSILFSGAERSILESTATKIIELLERPFLIDGQQINIGTSIGIAVAEEGSTYELLMKHSDLALYAAKEPGGGTFRYFHQSLADSAQARRKMELDLRKALPLRQLEVHYRPRIDVETGMW